MGQENGNSWGNGIIIPPITKDRDEHIRLYGFPPVPIEVIEIDSPLITDELRERMYINSERFSKGEYLSFPVPSHR